MIVQDLELNQYARENTAGVRAFPIFNVCYERHLPETLHIQIGMMNTGPIDLLRQIDALNEHIMVMRLVDVFQQYAELRELKKAGHTGAFTTNALNGNGVRIFLENFDVILDQLFGIELDEEQVFELQFDVFLH